MNRSAFAWLLTVGIALSSGGGLASARLSAEVSASLGSGSFMPKIRQQTLPSYSAEATSGIVDVEVVVGANGRVAHARVANSQAATGAIDRACLTALEQWRFEPAMAYGQPTATIVLVRFAFSAPSPGGGQGSVSARIEAVPDRPPPDPASLGNLVVHQDKEPGFRWPVAIRSIKASYTPDAMRAMRQGTVEVEVIVLADGTVGAARVLKSLDKSLDRAALIAARYWFFVPATVNGAAIASRATLELEFRLH